MADNVKFNHCNISNFTLMSTFDSILFIFNLYFNTFTSLPLDSCFALVHQFFSADHLWSSHGKYCILAFMEIIHMDVYLT